MKILENAHKQLVPHVCRCSRCGSKLEVEENDLTFVADQREGNAYTYRCPVCGHINWLAQELVLGKTVARR